MKNLFFPIAILLIISTFVSCGSKNTTEEVEAKTAEEVINEYISLILDKNYSKAAEYLAGTDVNDENFETERDLFVEFKQDGDKRAKELGIDPVSFKLDSVVYGADSITATAHITFEVENGLKGSTTKMLQKVENKWKVKFFEPESK